MAEKTVASHTIGQQVVGYMLNSVFIKENTDAIAAVQAGFVKQFGELIWSTPPETLHSTLLDWIAPLVDYGEGKDILYDRLSPRYDAVFRDILRGRQPISVTFNSLKVTPHAIILVGTDDGTIQRIRETFVKRVTLLPNTKQPPTIIHSTIARFTGEQDLQPIVDYASSQHISLDHHVDTFRLVRETVPPQLEYTLIKEYKLETS